MKRHTFDKLIPLEQLGVAINILTEKEEGELKEVYYLLTPIAKKKDLYFKAYTNELLEEFNNIMNNIEKNKEDLNDIEKKKLLFIDKLTNDDTLEIVKNICNLYVKVKKEYREANLEKAL